MSDKVIGYPNLESFIEVIKERNKILGDIMVTKPKRKSTEMEAIARISDWIGVSPSILIGVPIPDFKVKFETVPFEVGKLTTKEKIGSFINPEFQNRKVLPDVGKGNFKSVLDIIMGDYLKYRIKKE
jgi:hypothetical protein